MLSKQVQRGRRSEQHAPAFRHWRTSSRQLPFDCVHQYFNQCPKISGQPGSFFSVFSRQDGNRSSGHPPSVSDGTAFWMRRIVKDYHYRGLSWIINIFSGLVEVRWFVLFLLVCIRRGIALPLLFFFGIFMYCSIIFVVIQKSHCISTRSWCS